MPRISVISIARTEQEFEQLARALADQTYKDFEFVTSTKGTIPEAWNDAISRAKGDILAIIESDAKPLNKEWLEEISRLAKDNVVLKGLEITPTNLNLCDLVCPASLLKRERFDERFPVNEDTELFARLRKMGVKIQFINAFPVVHVRDNGWKKTLSRSPRIGMLFMKIIYMHGRSDTDDINTQNFPGKHIHPVSNYIREIVRNVLVLLGLAIGAVCYLPVLARALRTKDRTTKSKR
jgi:glycosyltransferase involved in cell wall biosynthesis